ncbi:MAG: nucleotide exchange factor GrpE [Oscillospiraceae bacterium]|nr:nucleotide exchange factor GrpE [Oscillospiraceae bacterium]
MEMADKKKQESPEEQEAEQAAPTPEEQESANAEETPAADEAPEKGENDRLLRLMAEFDNYKKRSARERENIYTDVRVDTVTRFLPVYDNLERALNAETADEAYKKGVEMTFQQLMEVFKKLGVEPIEALGQKFDPTRHNAVMHVDDEAYGENEVVQELQKGFILGEKVIRFSMVKVAN